MQRSLSFELSPPLSVPIRFLLTAPLFAALAGALLAWLGPAAWTSRWSLPTVALTHLLTLGCLTMTMIGALMQIMAVVGGVHMSHEKTAARGIYLLLTAGVLLLASAFLTATPLLFRLAVPLLLVTLAWFLAAAAMALRKAAPSGAQATIIGCTLALYALAITALSGAAMASAFGWLQPASFMPFTAAVSGLLPQLIRLHVLWGLAGWVGLLIAGIAYQVVPMFQVTEPYPASITRLLAPLLFLLCVLASAVLFLPMQAWLASALSWAILLSVAAGFCWFACVTLYLLAHRKRPQPDATTLFWRVSLIALLGGAGLLALRSSGIYGAEGTASAGPVELALGTLAIVGFGYSAINGMLYKIVPFLLWYHMQDSVREIGVKVPPVRQILPDHAAQKQFWLHLCALLLLIAACFLPQALSRPAALILCLSSLWLWRNLWQATRVYRAFFAP